MNKRNKKFTFNRWFLSRMKIDDTIALDQRSTYILPTKAGFLMVFIIFLMMVASTNYQNNMAFMLTFLILSISIVSIVFTFKNLQGLVFELGKNQSIFAGEKLAFNFQVSSQLDTPHSGIGVGFNKNSLFYLDLPGSTGKRITKQFVLPIDVVKRGWFSAPKIYTTSCFPFGLLKVWSWFKFKSPILIYPKPIEPAECALNRRESDEEGEKGRQSVIDDIEYDGVKAYRVGDPISRVDWKATAKERGVYIKSFTSLTSRESAFSWDDFQNVEDELRVSYLCYLVLNANRLNQIFSLSLPGRIIQKGSGDTHLHNCLSLLALF